MYMPTVICTFSISNRGVAVVHHGPVSIMVHGHPRSSEARLRVEALQADLQWRGFPRLVLAVQLPTKKWLNSIWFRKLVVSKMTWKIFP